MIHSWKIAWLRIVNGQTSRCDCVLVKADDRDNLVQSLLSRFLERRCSHGRRN